jgi:ribosomal 30S subunit maturation factor RimM
MVVGVMLAAAVSAMAQQTQDTSTPAASTTKTMKSNGPSGRLEQNHGAFRASKLLGATVYNDQGNSVGKVNDVLFDPAGKADKMVISVGGFLG